MSKEIDGGNYMLLIMNLPEGKTLEKLSQNILAELEQGSKFKEKRKSCKRKHNVITHFNSQSTHKKTKT